MTIQLHDPSLVEIRQKKSPLLFAGILFLVFTGLIMAWSLVMNGFVQHKIPFCYTTGERNTCDIAQALRTPDVDIAIVGSSLAKVLSPSFFVRSTMINLSVPGGSVMTGLEILNLSASPPKIILIEINILDREMDRDLAETSRWLYRANALGVLAGAAKPLRYLMTSPFFSFSRITMQQQTGLVEVRESIIAERPKDYDTEQIIETGKRQWDQRNFWDIAQKNLVRLNEITTELQNKGSKVNFLYIPFDKGYEDHPFTLRMRKIVSGTAFFDCENCMDVRKLVNVIQLRWSDGAHLDARSAALVDS